MFFPLPLNPRTPPAARRRFSVRCSSRYMTTLQVETLRSLSLSLSLPPRFYPFFSLCLFISQRWARSATQIKIFGFFLSVCVASIIVCTRIIAKKKRLFLLSISKFASNAKIKRGKIHKPRYLTFSGRRRHQPVTLPYAPNFSILPPCFRECVNGRIFYPQSVIFFFFNNHFYPQPPIFVGGVTERNCFSTVGAVFQLPAETQKLIERFFFFKSWAKTMIIKSSKGKIPSARKFYRCPSTT